MHEQSLVAGLIGQVEEVAVGAGARRVTGVRVRLGALSHLSADHLSDHFAERTRGTMAEGCRLDVEVDSDSSDPAALDVILVSVDVESG